MAKRSRPSPKPVLERATPLAHHDGERLQKILAAAGLGSRRECEELILAGRIEVDRRVVTTLGTKANPHEQEIRVDGEPLQRPKLIHYIVNKPPGIVCTNDDPSGRPRVIDLVPDRGGHLFAVGRLDLSSEGLMLVTNDGELANRLTHPRYEVEKTYHVEVAGKLDSEELLKLRRGVYLAEGFAKVVGATIKKQMGKSTLLEIVLNEGRNREIRRLLAKVGHKVLRLKRVAIASLRLGELPLGAFRLLTHEELLKLRETAAGMSRGRAARGKRLKKSGSRGPRPQGAANKLAPRKVREPLKPVGMGSVIGADDFPAKPAAKPGRKKPTRKPRPGRPS